MVTSPSVTATPWLQPARGTELDVLGEPTRIRHTRVQLGLLASAEGQEVVDGINKLLHGRPRDEAAGVAGGAFGTDLPDGSATRALRRERSREWPHLEPPDCAFAIEQRELARRIRVGQTLV